jgi:hypothetical protein
MGDIAKDLERLLANSLGATPGWGQKLAHHWAGEELARSAAFNALRTIVAFAAVVCGGMLLVSAGAPEPHLFWLGIWGALYLGCAVYTSQLATERVLTIVAKDMVPALSPESAEIISTELSRRFSRARVHLISWPVALVGLALASMALWQDMGSGARDYRNLEAQFVFWAIGWLNLFLTAARCTYVAQFYLVFAQQLAAEPDKLYPLNPSASPLVRNVSAIGRTIFAFWIGISISILSLAPLFTLGERLAALDLPDWMVSSRLNLPDWEGVPLFGLIVMPITLSFSLLFATLVFVRSEGAIRYAVDRATGSALSRIQRGIASLLEKAVLEKDDSERLQDLIKLHDAVSASASYRSMFLQWLSIVPLLTSVTVLVGSVLALGSPK